MAATFLSSIVLLLCGSQIVWSVNMQQAQTDLLNTMLNSSTYDVRVRPYGNVEKSTSTPVNVNMFVRTFNKVDDVQMQFHVQITFRQEWQDPRLKFDNMGGRIKFLQIFEFEKIWSPDLFFSNEVTGFINNLIKPNVYVRIFPQGEVLFSSRISLILGCPMNLQRFPFDRQICGIRMASYGYTTDDVVFLWKGDAVQMSKLLTIPGFSLESFSTDYCNSKTNTGEYSCLKVDFLLHRNLKYYITQIFIPCIMLVHISWFSFWLDIRAPMTRLFVTISPLLVMCMMVSDFNKDVPVTLYSKALDDFTGVCLLFIFASIVEFALVDYKWRSLVKKQQRATGPLNTAMDEENGTAFDMPLVNSPAETTSPSQTHSNEVGIAGYYHRWVTRLPKGPKKFDVVSRLLFPIAFTVYNIYYWALNILF